MDGTTTAQLETLASPTAALAAHTAALDAESLPPEAQRGAARHLADTLGAIVAGRGQPTVAAALAVAQELGGRGEVPAIGTGRRLDALSAATLMAVGAHAIELDDGNREGSFHPGTVVVPAVAAAAWQLDASGAEVIAAVAAGYEVAGRIARALHPDAGRRGFQTTPVAGVMGAAAAVGRLLRLDADAMEQAIGVAASSSGGLFAYLTGGGTVKKFHPGHAAREGVLAAFMVARGAVQGPRGVLETKAGVLQAFGGLAAWPARAGQPGAPPIVAASYLKPYPCCRHIHPAIDALLDLRARHALNPDAVERMEVGTYAVAMPHATLPWDDFVIAQLSFPYVMGVALRTGRVDLASFDEAARRDPAILRDVAKVTVAVDSECEANYPAQGPARVTLLLRDGRRLSAYVPEPLGSPARPLPEETFTAKLRMTFDGWLDAPEAARVLEMLADPAALPRWRTLHALLAKEPCR